MTNYNPKEERNENALKNNFETTGQELSKEHSNEQQIDVDNDISTENNISTEDISETKDVLQQSTEEKEEKEEKAPIVEFIHKTDTVEEYEEKTAGFWIRFWAFITDSLIVSAVVGILVNPIFYIMNWDVAGSTWYAPITIISGIFYYAYFVITTKLWQQTVGKMIFGLKVKSINGEKLSWSTVLFRELVSRFINNTIMPLYFIVAFTPKNMGVHDYFADTIVVQEKVYVKNKKTMIKKTPVKVNDSIHPTT